MGQRELVILLNLICEFKALKLLNDGHRAFNGVICMYS